MDTKPKPSMSHQPPLLSQVSPPHTCERQTLSNAGSKMQNSELPPLDLAKLFPNLKPSGKKTPEQLRRIRAIKLAACPIHTLPVEGGKPWGSLRTGYDDTGARISLFEKQPASSA